MENANCPKGFYAFCECFQDATVSLDEMAVKVDKAMRLIADELHLGRMDYEDMDQKIREHQIHLVIFCSPHNPTGRVWERKELEQAMDVFCTCLKIAALEKLLNA